MNLAKKTKVHWFIRERKAHKAALKRALEDRKLREALCYNTGADIGYMRGLREGERIEAEKHVGRYKDIASIQQAAYKAGYAAGMRGGREETAMMAELVANFEKGKAKAGTIYEPYPNPTP